MNPALLLLASALSADPTPVPKPDPTHEIVVRVVSEREDLRFTV